MLVFVHVIAVGFATYWRPPHHGRW